MLLGFVPSTLHVVTHLIISALLEDGIIKICVLYTQGNIAQRDSVLGPRLLSRQVVELECEPGSLALVSRLITVLLYCLHVSGS